VNTEKLVNRHTEVGKMRGLQSGRFITPFCLSEIGTSDHWQRICHRLDGAWMGKIVSVQREQV
jgi:hypothetical protein